MVGEQCLAMMAPFIIYINTQATWPHGLSGLASSIAELLEVYVITITQLF